MDRRSFAAMLALLSLFAPGCSNGPASDPEDSLANYIGCAKKRKWNCMVELLPPETRKKGGKTLGPRIAAVWEDKLAFKYTVDQTSIAGDFATIQITSEYTWQGVDARDIHTEKDQYDSYALQQVDGLWYVIPPALQKVQAF